MALPFTSREFLDVFARYNQLLWPAAVVLWLAAAAVLVGLLAGVRLRMGRPASFLLALLWFWGGAVYHAALFSRINPAAWGFAVLFTIQAGLLTWSGIVRNELFFFTASAARRALGAALALYALAYPAVNLWLGHTYPRTPTFGVPCPTTIFTVGLLVTCARKPRALSVVPLLWSLVGGSAAVLLGVTADLVLLACAVILVADALTPPQALPMV